MKKEIIILSNWYLPGNKAGGIIRAAENLVGLLSEESAVTVLTSSKDFDAIYDYNSIEFNKEFTINNYKVVYFDKSGLRLSKCIFDYIKQSKPDFIFVNGFFSLHFSIIPMILKCISILKAQLIVSPRGMLKSSALNFKREKKSLLLRLFKFLNLSKNVVFHATDIQESNDVKSLFKDANVVVVSDIPAKFISNSIKLDKEVGTLNLLFLGRIHPVKNLLFILELLKKIKEFYSINFSIVGNIEDTNYWEVCVEEIEKMPTNIKVEFLGEVLHQDVSTIINKNHLIINPSLGENFSYTIVESLQGRRPILISDQTPWKNLEQFGAGWDFPLANIDAFLSSIVIASQWSQKDFDLASENAINYYFAQLDLKEIKEKYFNLFKLNL
jgi:glycosyltransferase involved in cell wall biosynthesis